MCRRPMRRRQRPAKELKAFAKVQAGAGRKRQRVTLELDDRAFAYYRTEAQHWLVEPGRYVIRVARHAADAGLSAEVARRDRLLLPV
jgi:beta-glucosidase